MKEFHSQGPLKNHNAGRGSCNLLSGSYGQMTLDITVFPGVYQWVLINVLSACLLPACVASLVLVWTGRKRGMASQIMNVAPVPAVAWTRL